MRRIYKYKLLRLGLFILLIFLLINTNAQSYSGYSSNISTTTSLVVNKPAGLASGDLMIAQVVYNGGSNTTITAPTGWTKILSNNNYTNIGIVTYYRIATSADVSASNYTWGWSNSGNGIRWLVGISFYTNVDQTNPIDASSGSSGNTTSLVATSITTSNPNELVLALFGVDTQISISTVPGATEAYDISHSNNGPEYSLNYFSKSTAGVTGNLTATISTTNNYVSQQIAIKGTTSPSTITATGTTSFTYTGSSQGPSGSTVTGSTGAVTYSYSGTGSTTYGPSSTKPTSAGTYTVAATVAADANYSSATSSPLAFTISKVGLTVTALNQNVSYGTSVSTVTGAGTYTVTGFVNSETSSVISGTVTYTTNYTTTTSVGTATATITPVVTGLSATNYSFSAANGTISITSAASTITATGTTSYTYTGSSQGPSSYTKTGSTGAVTYSYSGTGSTTFGPSSTKPTSAGTYTVAATIAADANYSSATSAPLAFTISKVGLTVTAINQNVSYGTSVSTVTGAGTYTVTGFVNSETSSLISGTVTYNTNYTTTTTVGTATATITPVVTGLSATNYSFSAANGTISITSAASTITATGTTSYTYTGSSQGPSSYTKTGSTGAVTYSYSGTGSTTYGPSSTKPTSAGTYQVVATVAADANYSSATSSPLAFTISAPTSGLYFTQITPIPQTCYNLGSISLTVNGGTQPYKYDWTDISGTNNIQNRVGLVAGTYTITVTDAVGTTATSSIVILDNATGCTGISVCKSETASPFSVDPNPTITNYTWSVKDASNNAITNNQISGTGNAITIDWSSYAVGEYNVCAVTGNECTVNILPCQKVYVKQPLIAAFAEATCDAGTLKLHAYGADNYSWTGPAFTSNSADPILYNVGTSASGTYTLTATDANGCSSVATNINVLVNPKPDISSATVSPTSSCNGSGTGFITLNTLSGANTPTYSWTKTGSSYTNSSKDIASLTSGSYSVNVTNAEGCSNTFTYFVSSSSGNNFSVTATAIDISCYGGTSSATATITGSPTGTPTFAWSNQSGTYTSTSSTFLNIPAGTYNVVATDDNTCTSASSVTIHQPDAPLTAEASLTNVNCKGGNSGSITINAKGGTPSYTYSWVGPVGFNNPGNNFVASSLIAGTYSVTVTDANLCTYTNSYTLTEPAGVLSITSSVTAINCYGSSTGIVSLTTEGGTSPYSYSWSKSTGVGAGSYSATTSSISNISAGSYSVTITDNKGCTLTPSSIVVSQPSATLNFVATTPTNVNCYGGSTGAISLTAQGGTSGYTYSWSNGATTNSISNLSAGTYTATVTDNNGCTYAEGYSVSQPSAALSASSTITNLSCNAGTNGAVDLTVSGGTGAYSYAWSKLGAGTFSATSQDITTLSAGTYNVIITDANSCTVNASATVTEPAALTLSGAISNVLCNGASTGAIDITVGGGTGGYTYNWGSSITTEDRSSLAAGTYSVTVTDANNCTINGSYTITQPTALSLTLTNSNLTCNASNDGSINLTTTGGAGLYTYAWTKSGDVSFSATAQNISGLGIGTYIVTVTDASGCSATQTSTAITQPATLSVSIPSSTNINCFNGSTGAATASATGGTIGSGYNYSWTNGSIGASLANVKAGSYSVTVTDANGCSANSGLSLTQPDKAMVLYASVTDTRACAGTPSGKIEIEVDNSTGTLSYAWTGPTSIGNVATASNLAAGNYSVVVSNTNGCSATITKTVGTSAALAVTVDGFDRTCAVKPDGSAYAVVTGGVAPYTYLWSNAATTQSIGSLTTDTYSVTVTDANGCTSNASTTLTAPVCDVPIAVTDVFVTANGATITNTVATNDIDVAYAKSDLQFQLLSTPAPSQGTIEASLTGDFTFTPAAGFNGTVEIPYMVSNPLGLSDRTTLNIYVSNMTVSGSTVAATCSIGGSITINVAGGFPGYTYSWTGPNAYASTQKDLTGLAAGTYNVTVTDSKGATKSNAFTIAEGCIPPPGASTIYISGKNSFTYNGSAQGPTTTTKHGSTGAVTLVYTGTGSTTYVTSATAPTNIGTYKAVASLAADASYTSATSSDFAFTIEKIPSTIAVTGLTSYTYNGYGQGPVTSNVTGSTSTPTYNYSGTSSTVYGPSAIKPTAVGTYEVVSSVAADETYLDATSNSYSFNIVKANSTIQVNGNISYAYNGSGLGPVASTITGSTATPTYSYYGVGTTQYAPSASLPINIGSYEVVASVDGDDNYNAATSNAFAFTILDASTPAVVSINRVEATPTNLSTLHFAVTFSKDITGFDANDLTVVYSGTVSSTGISVTATSASTYNVTITGVNGNGTLGLNLKSSGTGITDLSSNALINGFTGQVYTVDKVTITPTITSPTANSLFIGQYLPLNINIPEVNLANTITLTFQGTSSNIIITLNNTSGTISNTLNTNNLAASSILASSSQTTLPAGVYNVTLSYQDYLGNPVASATINNFSINIGLNSTIVVTGLTTYTYNAIAQGPVTSTVTGSTGTVTYSYVGTGGTTYGPSATRPTDAGTYEVVATVAGDGTYTGATSTVYTFTINKASSTIVVTGLTTYTYNAAAQGPITSTVTGSTATPTYSYVGTGSTTYGPSATRPTDAGTYEVIATVAADANYNSATSASYAFTINKANSTIVATGSTTYTYNGSAQGPSTSNVIGSTGAVTYSYVGINGTTYGPSAIPPSNTGTYQVIASVAGNGNYNGATSVPFAFSIAQFASNVTVTGLTTYTYNSAAQGPTTSTVTGSTGTVTYSYVGTGGTTYGPSATRPIDAGTYEVVATVAGDGTYTGATSAAYTFTINKAASTIVATGLTTYTYNSAAQGPVTSTVTGSTGTVTYSYVGTGSTTYGPSATRPTTPGTYEVVATVAADANYTGATSIAYAFTINKASSTIVATGLTTYTYNAAAQGPITSTVTGSTGTVTYSYVGTGGTTYGPSATRPTTPGTYEVVATVVADANYTGATSTAYAFTINKAASTIVVTGNTTYTYNEFAQGPSTSTVTGSTGAVTYSYVGTGGTTYGPNATAPSLPGTYQVIATVAADANYQAATSLAYAFSITQVVAPPVVNNGSYIFNQSSTPKTLAPLVVSKPAGSVPVWCDANAANCVTTAPAMPTIIGKYVYQLRSFDTTTLLYSTNYINDTIVIAPPKPTAFDSTYVIGVASNPSNVSIQVSGLTGASFNYYYLATKLTTVPTLGNTVGVKKYTVSQTINSIEGDTTTFSVTMLDPATIIHLQKIVDSGKLQSNSTFNYPFTFLVSNLTKYPFSNVVVTDNLHNSVPITSDFSIISNTATGGLVANGKFDGMNDINVTASSALMPFAIDTSRFTMNLVPKGYNGTLSNIAYVKADTKWGTIVMQSSASATNGTYAPTTYYVKDLAINIPEGFSPNHDGVHDYFVIIKPYKITLDLQVFNRWGNIVYANSNYKNEWDGKGTGNFAGQDLVDGGYYYTLRAVDDKGATQVFNGFVIIQR